MTVLRGLTGGVDEIDLIAIDVETASRPLINTQDAAGSGTVGSAWSTPDDRPGASMSPVS